MIILLSPSKTMDFESESDRAGVPPIFEQEAHEIAHHINDLDPAEFQILAKTSDKVTDEARAKFANFDNCRPRAALWAYTGMVYTGLDAKSFSQDQIDFAQKHLRVLSAVYGYVRPLDLIKKYRLEMQTKLTINNTSNLYQFWGDKLTRALLDDKPGFILNLASEEYIKALRKYLPGDLHVITPKFLEDKNGQLKDITVNTKRARGALAGWLIKNQIDRAGDLPDFDQGYRFDVKQSTDDRPVFIKLDH